VKAYLESVDLDVGYGDLRAVSGVNVSVAAGEVVALIGPNGAGKTTTLQTLVGVLPALSGEVLLDGVPARGPLHVRVRNGLAFIPDEKMIVMALSVRDNIRLSRAPEPVTLELFPELEKLIKHSAGSLSGGEQQILTLAMGLARKPKIVIVDELSLGLAPMVSERLAQALRDAADRGTAVLVVEQNLKRALAMSDRFYMLRNGSVQFDARSDAYRDRIPYLTDFLLQAGSAHHDGGRLGGL